MKKTEEGTGKRKCGACKACILVLSMAGLALAVYNLRKIISIEVRVEVDEIDDEADDEADDEDDEEENR